MKRYSINLTKEELELITTSLNMSINEYERITNEESYSNRIPSVQVLIENRIVNLKELLKEL